MESLRLKILPLRAGKLASSLTLLLGFGCFTAVRPVPANPDALPSVFPGKEWAQKAPGEVRLKPDALEAFSRQVGGRGCVVRHGYLVYTWGDAARAADVASACKPWYTHFLLKAIEDGRLSGLDAKVSAVEPRLGGLNPGLGSKDGEIRWRHLAFQTSCYGVREAPGEAFDYSDYNMALFPDLLFLRVWGATWETVDEKVLRPLLTEVLECQDGPTLLAFGASNRPGRLAVSPRDFARFGLLYLRKGEWRGRQVLRLEHAVAAVSNPLPAALPRTKGEAAEMLPGQRSIGGGNNQTDHHGSYSFAWWTNGLDRSGRRHWPLAPEDTYGCLGHGGKRAMVVLPRYDLVVSWNDAAVDGREAQNAVLGLLVAAVQGTEGAKALDE